jgi:hypothetical protein
MADETQAQVQAAVVEALARDPEELVQAVVDMALSEKRNSYDRATIWQTQVHKMIRDAAQEAFREWLVEQRPLVAKAVRGKLESRRGVFFKRVLDGLLDAMTRDVTFTVAVNYE